MEAEHAKKPENKPQTNNTTGTTNTPPIAPLANNGGGNSGRPWNAGFSWHTDEHGEILWINPRNPGCL